MMTKNVGVMAVAVALVATAAPAQNSKVNPRLLPSIPDFSVVDAASIAKRARPGRSRDVVRDLTLEDLQTIDCVVIGNLVTGSDIRNVRQVFDVRRVDVSCR